jgi:hypothetical protein
MKLEKVLPFLKNPGSDLEVEFMVNENYLVDKRFDKRYSLINNMVDFLGVVNSVVTPQNKGLLFKLNAIYSDHLDPWIRTSIFAGGSVAFIKSSRKMKSWIDQYAKGDTLFIEPEDDRLINYISDDKCLTVEDFSAKNTYPMETDYPNLSASPEQLPIRSSSFQNIISNYVLEHIKNPRLHMQELARILQPGGYAIIGGPGDIYPSHRVPHNYFNIIRYGYFELFKENDLELVEEYFPAKSWMSILYIAYTTTVRNTWFNKNQFTKLVQLLFLSISLVVSPIFNLLALLLDLITPFDQRGYSIYLALVRKPFDK